MIAGAVRRDYGDDMFKWFRRTAHQAELSPGLAERPDYDDAIKWYRKAAEKGTSWGQFKLGVSYGHGEGVPQDYAESIKWFTRAAEQGEAMSQYSLGSMYEKGLGVTSDAVEAYKWFHLAASHGIQGAGGLRDHIQLSLTSEQIADGQHRAEMFVPKKSPLSQP